MPLPFVLATIVLVRWLACGCEERPRRRSPRFPTRSSAPIRFSTATARIWSIFSIFSTGAWHVWFSLGIAAGRRWIWLAGLALGLAALVKQVAGLHLAVFAMAYSYGGDNRVVGARIGDVAALIAGFLTLGDCGRLF